MHDAVADDGDGPGRAGGGGAGLAAKVQANDVSGLQAATAAAYAKDFSGIGPVVGSYGGEGEGRYADRGAGLSAGCDAVEARGGWVVAGGAVFLFAEQDGGGGGFLIPGLAPGRYGFAIVDVTDTSSPWRLSFLLRQDQGQWTMAGFYPKPMTAAGHDGLWYWTQARTMTAQKEHWNAWLYYQQAESLLTSGEFYPEHASGEAEDGGECGGAACVVGGRERGVRRWW